MPPKVSVARAKTKTASSREPTSIVAKTIKDLELSPDVALVLRDIEAQIAEAYRDRFLDMTEMLRQQMSMAARTQETLNILVEFLAPQLAGSVPTAVKIATDGSQPDLASALVVADPIGAGYTLTQVDLSRALGVSSADISILVRGFDVNGKEECAVTVRQGAKHKIVNYHPRAVDVLRRFIESPPADVQLNNDAKAALKRARGRLSASTTD